MNQRETNQEPNKESTISKAIFESISPQAQLALNMKRISSAPNLKKLNLSFILPEEEKSEEEKDSDSNHEYKIGNYMVKYTLGQGTFGKVKLGVYIPNNEKVAIKILEKNRITEKDDEIRVKREFDMLAQFSHPNVILVAEIFESEESYYSVMEFCEGGELFNYIVKKSRLSEEESSFFFYQLINGLEYIHSLGIVHRDLKPENLLLTSDHILKIIDFGLSNYFKSGQTELLSTPCGSPCYASPEMVAGKKYDGCKIDIWSCGIILYAMLCGYLPFEDPDNEVLFKKILECKLDFPNYVGKTSIDLIEKILVTDPEKRITIPEIKKHEFYIKGKDIFEEGFSIEHIMKNPIEKNMSNKNIITNNKEDKEEEAIKDKNIEINNNREKELEKEKGVEIEIDLGKENPADIGVKKEEINDNNKNLETIDINNNINKKLEKKENIRKKKSKTREKENKGHSENHVEKKNNRINENKNNKEIRKKNINDYKKEKKQNKLLNIKINLDNNSNKNETVNKNDAYAKNLIPTEKEEEYIPLQTEYSNENNRFNTLDVMKENKKSQDLKNDKKEKLNPKKKVNDHSSKAKETNLKKYFELKPKEKSTEKEKPKQRTKPKEKSADKFKEKDITKNLRTQITNIIETKPNLNNQNPSQRKKTVTPKKIFYISKNVKSQRPSNIHNVSKRLNLNLKINPRKYLQQKLTRLEQLVSAKDPKKNKSPFAQINMNLNINKYGNYTFSHIKGVLSNLNTNKKILNENKENKENHMKYLKTETSLMKEKNYLDKNNNTIINTIDSIKTNLANIISDTKNVINKNKMKKNELINAQIRKIYNDIKDKKKLSEMKRLKSSTLNGENVDNNINNKTFQINSQNHISKQLQMIRNKANIFSYGMNNFTNYKIPYEININDNNKTLSNTLHTNINTLKTEPTSEIYPRLNYQKKDFGLNPQAKYLKKTSTNTTSFGDGYKGMNTIKTNLPNRYSNVRYLKGIRKAPTYNILKTMNMKNIPMTTPEALRTNKLLGKERKNTYSLIKNSENNLSKKSQGVTIRNTVINFNMIDTGFILPSVKKIKSAKKYNSTYNTNKTMNLRPNKKYSKEISTMSNINTMNTIENLNLINQENKYNNTINRFSNINNSSTKPLANRINTDNNKISSISTFHKLVNKMKTKQKYNKIQFNNLNLNNNINHEHNHINTINNKNHNKIQSMRLKEYFKTNKPEKKHLEISGINTISNNILSNTSNNSINNMVNRLRTINNDKNIAFPALINKNKKFIIPKGKGYVINQQGKINKLQTYIKTPINLNRNSNDLRENFNSFQKMNEL